MNKQVHHQAKDLARREVLADGFVGKLGEFADEFLEHQAHLHVVDLVRVQLDAGELLSDLIQQLGLVQALDRGGEIEVLEDRAHVRSEALDVAVEVGADVVLIAHELAHVQRRDVVEVQAGLALDEGFEGDAGRLSGGVFLERGSLAGREHAVQPAQHGERQNDAAVFALLEVAAQAVGDGPDEGGEGLLVHGLAGPP